MKYSAVHFALKQAYGPARNYFCPCGSTAADWAYQRPGEGLFDDNFKAFYSEDLSDYLPMCRSCHKKLDSSQQLDQLSAMGKKGIVAAAPKLKEHRQMISRMNSSGPRRICKECGFVSVRTGLGRHQQVSGHSGFEEVDHHVVP